MSLVEAGRLEILLVDDDRDHRTLAGDLLRDDGFLVIEAAHGRAALDYLLGAAWPPALILTDLRMPVMTGWEMISAVRSSVRTAHVPIVVVSSEPAPPPGIEPSNIGRLAKPYMPDDLLAIVRAHTAARLRG